MTTAHLGLVINQGQDQGQGLGLAARGNHAAWRSGRRRQRRSQARVGAVTWSVGLTSILDLGHFFFFIGDGWAVCSLFDLHTSTASAEA